MLGRLLFRVSVVASRAGCPARHGRRQLSSIIAIVFGVYRYLLATMVAVGHLWPNAGVWLGPYAVFGFYALSGYLMTLVLNRTYAPSTRATLGFFGNRALRIYPPYWVALAFSLALAAYAPDQTRSYHAAIVLPRSAGDWLRNLSLAGLGAQWPVRLVPPAWSLCVELFFYLVLGLGLARGPRRAAAWFTASAAYTAWLVATGAPAEARYYPIAAASLPFSLGSLLFHLGGKLDERDALPLGFAAFAGFLAIALGARHLWRDPMGAGLYASLVFSAATVLGLARLPRARVPRWLARIDGRAGDLSYPIFLCHWPVAIAVALLLGTSARLHVAGLAVAVFSAVNACAWLLHAGVERPVSRLRDRLREQGERPR